MPNAEKRDFEETARRLTPWLRKRLPDAGDLRVLDLTEPSNTGFSSETLLFTLESEVAGSRTREELVMRLEPTGFNVFPDYDVSLQFRLMHALEDTDVPVPRMRWLEEDSELLGVPFFVMDRVEGGVPTDNPPYNQGGWVSELSPERREKLWWSGLDAMASVHRLDWQALGFGSLEDRSLGPTPLAQQLKYYDDYFTWGMEERSRYPVTQAALDFLYANAPADPPVVLCWGDSRLANQIFDEEECVAVIDWEMAHLGSPVEDLAWWLTADRCFSEGIGSERGKGFPSHSATVERWEQQSGFEALDLQYYQVLALMRFSIHIGRLGLQMKHYGVLPADANFDCDNFASQTLEKVLEEAGS